MSGPVRIAELQRIIGARAARHEALIDTICTQAARIEHLRWQRALFAACTLAALLVLAALLYP